jgi:transcriptional regulator with XRE-family HTH domain
MTPPTSKPKATKGGRGAKRTKPASSPSAATVGGTLKAKRLEQGLTLAEVERATRVRGKYLVAIESGDHAALPHRTYVRGFIQSYANHLELDGDQLAGQYQTEQGQQEMQLRHQAATVSSPKVLSPRLLTLVGGLAFAAAVVGYLLFQLSSLTAPPQLSVTNPSHDQVLYGSLITVSGHVAGGASAYVNSSPILVDSNGNFTDAIALHDGVNSITISATGPLGKTATVTRNILAHVPSSSTLALPAAPFPGVAVSVQVQNNAATVTVRIDGKSAFQGTMLPGTTQTFQGSSSVQISTSNGAATSLSVTNSTTAGQNLGAMGTTSSPRDDFEFTSDTQFQ